MQIVLHMSFASHRIKGSEAVGYQRLTHVWIASDVAQAEVRHTSSIMSVSGKVQR